MADEGNGKSLEKNAAALKELIDAQVMRAVEDKVAAERRTKDAEEQAEVLRTELQNTRSELEDTKSALERTRTDLRQLDDFRQGAYQGLIQHLFEHPKQELEESIRSEAERSAEIARGESKRSVRITLLAAVGAIILGVLTSVLLQIWNSKGAHDLQDAVDSSASTLREAELELEELGSEAVETRQVVSNVVGGVREVSESLDNLDVKLKELGSFIISISSTIDGTLVRAASAEQNTTEILGVLHSNEESAAVAEDVAVVLAQTTTSLAEILESLQTVQSRQTRHLSAVSHVLEVRGLYGGLASKNAVALLWKTRLGRWLYETWPNAGYQDVLQVLIDSNVSVEFLPDGIQELVRWDQELVALTETAVSRIPDDEEMLEEDSPVRFFSAYSSQTDETDYGGWQVTGNPTSNVRRYLLESGEYAAIRLAREQN